MHCVQFFYASQLLGCIKSLKSYSREDSGIHYSSRVLLFQVNRTIKMELGKDPSELFSTFDTTALATASVSLHCSKPLRLWQDIIPIVFVVLLLGFCEILASPWLSGIFED